MDSVDRHRFLVRHFRPYWRWMAAGIACGLAAIAGSIGLMAVSGWFISAAALAGISLSAAPLFNFFFPSIGVRLFALLRTGARYGERILSHSATFRILEGLRIWFYTKIEPLAPARLMRHRSGDLLNRIVDDIDALDNLYLRVLSPTVVAVIIAPAVTFFLWIFSPAIALAAFCLLAAAGVLVSLIAARRGGPIGKDISARTAMMRIRIVDGLQGVSELLVFGGESRQLEKIRRSSLGLIADQRRMSRISGVSAALLTLFSGLAVAATLYFGASLVYRGTLAGENLALTVFAVMAAFEAAAPLPGAFQYLGRTREAGKRLLEIVETEPEVVFTDRSPQGVDGYDLALEGVCFKYSETGPVALKDVDLVVSHGERVGILGATGCGKSTLVNLLVRFWDPTTGRITLGGKDIRTLGETELRAVYSVVPQQPHLFNGSLRENLLLADSRASERDMLSALDAARLGDFVSGLPRGLDTLIGEAGKRISGGQARRLAVARAVLRDAPVWILDEPTEGLDRNTKRDLLGSLDGLTRERTLLLITHRLTDLDRLDRIVIFDRGRIVEQGTPAELAATGGRYATLAASLF
jgi:ATP-binding cassette, subfamily C, bacterial CydC